MNIENKRVLITGASSGIGKETAMLFASHGASLVLAARRANALEELASTLRETYRCNADILPLDASETQSARNAVQTYLLDHPIDIAIVNHGIGQYGRFAQSAWSDLEPVLLTNFIGAANIAHTVLPGMVERKQGSVVFISSVLGKRAVPNNAAYCASKFALHGLADALRLEVRKSGVHIGVVAPSRTDTPFFRSMKYSERQGKPAFQQFNPPSFVAGQIYRCVAEEKREIIVSLPGKVFCAAGYHFPRLTDWILARKVPVPQGAGDE